MQFIPVTLIRAQRLYSIPLQSLLICQARCLQDAVCFYMIMNDLEKKCTFYQIAVTIQNVTNYKTYGLILKDINVSISNYVSILYINFYKTIMLHKQL